MRSTASAVVAHSMPLGASRPDPVALDHPGGHEPGRQRGAGVVELGVGDGVVGGHEGAPVAVDLPPVGQQRRDRLGRQAATEQLLEGAEVELAARHHRHVVVGDDDDAAGDLVGRQPLPQAGPQVVDVDGRFRRRPHERRHHLAAGRVVDADDVGDEARDLEDRRLDLARRHVGARRLDHVAAAAPEVDEAVVVDGHEVAGAVPAVGVEGLVPLAAVVALHQERAPEPQLADLARPAAAPPSSPAHLGLEPGHRRPERAPAVLGLLGLVLAGEAHAAGLGHAEHRVAQLGVGGAHVRRHDRPQVAAADRRQVAAGERRVVGQVGDRGGEAVDHRRPLALEHVEHAGGGGRVRAHQRGPGHQRAEQGVGEAADPEERRVREQHLAGDVPAQLVEVVEVADEGAVGVDHALGLAGRARGVHDHHAVGRA